ncbi:MAG: hypothetical protein QOH84_1556 [Kribbellaceae bacterium]|nr:hypothetical protein [Kribbellaceae bacterium]
MTPADIVRLALPVFHAHPYVPDDDLVDALTAAGVPYPELVVAFLPVAYGRRMLEGRLQLPDTFIARGREYPLAGDQLYAAADQLARTEATRADIEVVGGRSAEVSVVTQVLDDGLDPAGVALSSPAFLRL